MDKICEFCTGLSPVVYCKADAAHLCLSCDAKVHSANALSYRHPRTLICESCRYQPAHVRCFDHKMFMCQSCDSSHHISFHHHKKVVSCYVGCPSAKDLAVLWGFDLNQVDKKNIDSREGYSSSRRTKVVNEENRQQSNSLILQQILELERFQLNERVDDPCLVHSKEKMSRLSFKHDAMWKIHNTLDEDHHHPEEPVDGNLDFQHHLDILPETKEPFSSPFSQLDHLTTAGNPDSSSFWQCRSPANNIDENWLQNMQELGVCDELRCFDDVDIPDVDLTFRNFEELFGGDHEANRTPVDNEITACSFANQHLPSVGSDKAYTTTSEDTSGSSHNCLMQKSMDMDKENGTSNNKHQNCPPRTIRPSYSSSSFSVSRLTAESSGSEYKEDGLSPAFAMQQFYEGSYENNTKTDGKENVIMRHKEKKISRHEKQAQYAAQRSKSDGRRRGKGLASKIEGHDCDSTSVARSF